MSGLGPSESALLETILKEAPVGFAFFDTSARFQRVNPTLARLYGRAEEECIGRLPHD
ncbi:PAS domain-containing protein, partial [Nocardiopsis composta]